MKRVCFIGNSHVGCMKLGVEAAREAGRLDGFDVTIFGSRGDKLKNATVENGIVQPNNATVEQVFKWTSGGRGEIELSEFDLVFLFAGLPPTCIDGFFVRDPVTGIFDMPVFSDQLLSRILDSLHATWHIKLARDIALSKPDISVKFVGRPYRSDDSPVAIRVLKRLDARSRAFSDRVTRVKNAIDAHSANSDLDNLEFVRPVDDLLERHGLYTKREYTRGSLRLSKKTMEHPQDDYLHMNQEYGETMVSHLLGLNS